jgi:hypothetical protein
VAGPARGVARHGADVGGCGAGAAELDGDGEGFFGGGCAGGLLGWWLVVCVCVCGLLGMETMAWLTRVMVAVSEVWSVLMTQG